MGVLLGTQQLMVEFADALQSGFEFLIITEPLLNGGDDLRAEAKLFGAAAGVGDGQDPDGVTLALGADRATGTVADVAMEQRAAEDFSRGREMSGEFGAGLDDLLLNHSY